jgi:O-glycosyl hydrolase
MPRRLVGLITLCAAASAEIAVMDGNGRLVSMLYSGQDAAVRTDLVLPGPGWARYISLGSAENLQVSRGEVSSWQGTLPLDSTHRLRFRQTMREQDGRVLLSLEYTALDDLVAEGLYFRINIPWLDFKGGEVTIGARSVKLPEAPPANVNLLAGETPRLDARGPAAALAWAAQFSRPLYVNLQDKSTDSPKNFAFWVYLHRGTLPAGTTGSFDLELTIDGQPDTTPAGLVVDVEAPVYRFDGFGGNYCFQIESPVTAYTLANLNSRWARTEMSMVEWEPQNDNGSPYETDWERLAARDRPDTRLRREFELMRTLQERGIPFAASIWRLPEWLLGDRDSKRPDDQRRVIDPALWDELLEAIGSYLLYAREVYGVEPDLFSFNEPEIGIRILFSAQEHRDAIRRIGAHLAGLGLKTRMLLGDVSNPRGTHTYTLAAEADAEAMQYVGAISFHSWGGATPAQYAAWTSLAARVQRPLLVAELGVDPSAWQGRAYDSYWYGIEELRMYQELMLYARPQGTMYWEFTGDYALVRQEGANLVPTGRFWLTKHLTDLTPPGAMVLATRSDHPKVLVTAFEREGAYTVHIANLSAGRDAELTGLPRHVASWRAVLTSESDSYRDLEPLAAEDGGMRVALPARSLLTLVYRP